MDATRLILFNSYMTVVEVGAHSLLYSWTSRDPETEINYKGLYTVGPPGTLKQI